MSSPPSSPKKTSVVPSKRSLEDGAHTQQANHSSTSSVSPSALSATPSLSSNHASSNKQQQQQERLHEGQKQKKIAVDQSNSSSKAHHPADIEMKSASPMPSPAKISLAKEGSESSLPATTKPKPASPTKAKQTSNSTPTNALLENVKKTGSESSSNPTAAPSTPIKLKFATLNAPSIPESPFVIKEGKNQYKGTSESTSRVFGTPTKSSTASQKTFGAAFAGPTFGSLSATTSSSSGKSIFESSVFSSSASSSPSKGESKGNGKALEGKQNEDEEENDDEDEDDSKDDGQEDEQDDFTKSSEDTDGFGKTAVHTPLPEKEIVTGEEQEETLYTARAKLYVLDATTNIWKERSVGNVRLNQEIHGTKVRIVMRSEAVHNLLLNVPLFPEMHITLAQDKFIRFAAVETASNEETKEPKKQTSTTNGKTSNLEKKIVTYALKFGSPLTAQEFISAINECLDRE